MVVHLDAVSFRDWTRVCTDALSRARAEIDALNVFPVADSDTGTNAYFTFARGQAALDDVPADASLADTVKAYSRALLINAKGNTGVISSQLARAFFHEIDPIAASIDAGTLARAFRAASEAADAAVGVPVEGTILSVARAAADGAAEAAETGANGRAAFAAAARAARSALVRTPHQLERLARAGVVDAGGRALVVILDATEQLLTGRRPDPVASHVPVPQPGGDDFVEGGPAYEVMYLLEADDTKVPVLRERLAGLGDSLVVVGGDRLWNVHVHVNDVGAAIEVGLDAGRPFRIAVTHFADQIEQQRQQREGRVVIAAVTGEGLAELCRTAGAQVVTFSRDEPLTQNAADRLLRDCGAAEVVVLPNARGNVGLFEAAAAEARREGVRVAVLPTNTQVQGLVALAVHDPGRRFDDDVISMSSAAAHTRHGAVTIATEPGITMAGPCRAGDSLGVVQGDFAIVGHDIVEVADSVVQRLLTPTSELITLVIGADAPEGLGPEIATRMRERRVDVDVEVVDGRQHHYPLFVAVE